MLIELGCEPKQSLKRKPDQQDQANQEGPAPRQQLRAQPTDLFRPGMNQVGGDRGDSVLQEVEGARSEDRQRQAHPQGQPGQLPQNSPQSANGKADQKEK